MNDTQIARKAWADLRKYLHLSHLSRDLGLSRNAAYAWTLVPQHHVDKIIYITGIPGHRLRPDLYDDPWLEI